MEDTRYVIEEKLKYILWTAEAKESARPDEPAVYQEQEDQIFRLEEQIGRASCRERVCLYV